MNRTDYNIGDIIKAYDFQPMEGRDDVFMTGKIVAKGPIYVERDFGEGPRRVYMCDGYTIDIVDADDRTRESRVGDTGYVPFQVDIFDYNGRIELVATAEELYDISEEFSVA